MALRTLGELGDVRGKVVGVRVDFNVPLDAGTITDDGRIHAGMATLRELASRGARIVAMSHLGRPEGKPDPQYSLAPVVARLGELWPKRVVGLEAVVGPEVETAIASLDEGEIAVVGNLRFDSRETSKDEALRQEFAQELARPLDALVSDGFGVVHRAQASVVELMKLRPSVAGLLIEREVGVLHALLDKPARPYTVVLGGSKVSDKLGVIEALLPHVDNLVIGGGMVFTVLQAMGCATGASLLESDQVDKVRGYLEKARQSGVRVVTPVDIVMAQSFAADSPHEILSVSELESGTWGDSAMGLDIGPASAREFYDVIRSSRTVFWNGPMGVFEFPAFAEGTRQVAMGLRECAGLTVVGGGDSAAAVRTLGFADHDFGHISTGGGASLEFLEGQVLPGLSALGWENR